MIVYLTGYMGSGKTTCGRTVAEQMRYKFIDLDEYIEKKQGTGIRSIFEQDGEERFREMERDALRELGNKTSLVLATGGGTPCFFGNMEFMNETGITVYLKVGPEELAGRLLRERANRPLISNIEVEGLLEFICKQLSEREVDYLKAKHTVTACREVENILKTEGLL